MPIPMPMPFLLFFFFLYTNPHVQPILVRTKVGPFKWEDALPIHKKLTKEQVLQFIQTHNRL